MVDPTASETCARNYVNLLRDKVKGLSKNRLNSDDPNEYCDGKIIMRILTSA